MKDKTNKNSELSGISFSELVKYWAETRFPRAMECYIKEWVYRYEVWGHSAFLAHMDGDSRRTWYSLYSEWAALNFPAPEQTWTYCEPCETITRTNQTTRESIHALYDASIVHQEDPDLSEFPIKECSICGTQL
tara:strand:- start:54 stop:455 length:402 start_codon:yes stop_codon:yes gene_type:complete